MGSDYFVLPADFKYVLAALYALCLLNMYAFMATGRARKLAGVPYPNAYATHEEAEKEPAKYRFNCAQRAHANLLDQFPTILSSLLVSGARYPRISAIFAGIYVLGRAVYTVAYGNSQPGNQGKERSRGFFYSVGYLGLLGTALWSLGEMFYIS